MSTNVNAQVPPELELDRDHLYREELVTDLKVGSIRTLVPVTVDGSRDPDREPVYVGETQLMSQVGPLPVQAPIEASSLAEAVDAFPAAMQRAIEQMIEEAREARRQEAGRIAVPGRDFPPNVDLTRP